MLRPGAGWRARYGSPALQAHTARTPRTLPAGRAVPPAAWARSHGRLCLPAAGPLDTNWTAPIQSPRGKLDSGGGCWKTCFQHQPAPTSLKRGDVSPGTTPRASTRKAGPVLQAHPPGACPLGPLPCCPQHGVGRSASLPSRPSVPGERAAPVSLTSARPGTVAAHGRRGLDSADARAHASRLLLRGGEGSCSPRVPRKPGWAAGCPSPARGHPVPVRGRARGTAGSAQDAPTELAPAPGPSQEHWRHGPGLGPRPHRPEDAGDPPVCSASPVPAVGKCAPRLPGLHEALGTLGRGAQSPPAGGSLQGHKAQGAASGRRTEEALLLSEGAGRVCGGRMSQQQAHRTGVPVRRPH